MKILIRPLLIFIVISVLASKVQAQYYFYNEEYYDNPVLYEVGASVGAMNGLTDIGGHKGLGQNFLKDLNTGQSQLCGSIYGGAMIKSKVGIRAEFTFGKIIGNDNVLKSDIGTTSDPRYDRNLSFRTPILEFTVMGEIYPTYLLRRYDAENNPPKAAPYFMIGLGYFHFNPQAYYNGQWVDLHPLRLEGQGMAEYPDRPAYNLGQMNIPMGIGVKYELGARMNMRAEFLFRKLNTDYLDDVSQTYIDPNLFQKYLSGAQLQQALALNYRGKEIGKDHDHQPGAPRGNPKNNDSYFSFNIKAGYILGRTKIK